MNYVDSTNHDEQLQDKSTEYVDDAPLHMCFTMIPNVVFEMNLPPIQLSLYTHLRRICGETGRCWMKSETLAERCGVSEGAISQAKKELVSKGLLRVEKGSRLKHETDRIHLVDIWDKNREFFKNRELRSSLGELGSLLGEKEEEPYTKKNNIAGASQPAPPEEKKVPPKLSPLNSKLFLEALRDDPQSSTEGSGDVTKVTSGATTSLGETVPGDNKRYQRKKKKEPIGFTPPEPPKERPRDLLWDAVEALTKINVKLYGSGRFAKELKAFRGIGATPEQVQEVGRFWYKHDWRGQKNQPPTLQNLREIWNRALAYSDEPGRFPIDPKRISKTMQRQIERWKEMDDEERNSK